jgi:uroporphyrinogen decarboxylase
MNSEKAILKTFKNLKQQTTPIWLMRQAGRYLPEYREIRKNAGSFLDLCYNPELACTVTLQPITRFGFDASIIFSDILVIPDAMGMDVTFVVGEGPQLKAIKGIEDINNLTTDIGESLEKVYQAIKLTKAALPNNTTMIGFAGSPWTIATYMIEGKGSKDFALTKKMAYTAPDIFSKMIDKLIISIADHLINQIDAGAELLQVFDSWSSALDYDNFIKWVIEPTKKIISLVKAKHPLIPIIGFPKNAGMFYKIYAEQTGIDGISIDANLPYEYIEDNLKNKLVIQGNIDPVYLLGNAETLKRKIIQTLDHLHCNQYIFNLGHGIIKETPIENVELLVSTIREYK